jgi:hypothetical protein
MSCKAGSIIARAFGIKAFNQRRRAFEVSKQRCDRFTLAVGSTADFQRRLLRADALGEVGRRVADRSRV